MMLEMWHWKLIILTEQVARMHLFKLKNFESPSPNVKLLFVCNRYKFLESHLVKLITLKKNETFQKVENHCSSDVFKEVKSFLRKTVDWQI